jgi:hypothetical protein
MEQPQIRINVGIQRDGYVFELRPTSRDWLEQNYPDKYRIVDLFIGFDKHQNLQQIPESVWDHISYLLTGLSLEEINQIGGFTIYNPLVGQEIFNSLFVHV